MVVSICLKTKRRGRVSEEKQDNITLNVNL